MGFAARFTTVIISLGGDCMESAYISAWRIISGTVRGADQKQLSVGRRSIRFIHELGLEAASPDKALPIFGIPPLSVSDR